MNTISSISMRFTNYACIPTCFCVVVLRCDAEGVVRMSTSRDAVTGGHDRLIRIVKKTPSDVHRHPRHGNHVERG